VRRPTGFVEGEPVGTLSPKRDGLGDAVNLHDGVIMGPATQEPGSHISRGELGVLASVAAVAASGRVGMDESDGSERRQVVPGWSPGYPGDWASRAS
jgi:hypothetical protein